jgi:uncharacterized protein
VNDNIKALHHLQQLDLALESLRANHALLAPRRASIDKEKQSLVNAFEESKKSFQQAQLDKKRLEGEAEAKDQAVRKHTGELNSVKSNDAYKALLTEIENAKSEKAAIEDKVLEVMELQDRLQKELKEREKTLDADKAALDRRAAEAAAEEKAAEAKVAEAVSAREAYAATVDAPSLKRYEAVRRGRSSFAVLAEVKDLICGGCRTRLPPDVVNSIMKGKDVVSCEGCSRILYIVPAPPQPAKAE